MADATISSAVLKDGTLTITGTGFTKTTTTVAVDDSDVAFTANDAGTQITVEGLDADAASVEVTKGGVTASADITTNGAPVAPIATETPVTPEGASLAQQQKAAMEPDRSPLGEGEHLPGDFRFRVENTAAGDLNMDPREPYPTGNPPDPREEFYRINGFYPGEGGTVSTPKGA